MEIVDDRPDDTNQLWLVVGTDTFMSGWGLCRNGISVCAWAFETHEQAEYAAREHISKRCDMEHIHIVKEEKKGSYKPRVAMLSHFHIYDTDPQYHRYYKGNE